MLPRKRRTPALLRFETERLILRPHTEDDAANYLAWDRDPELVYLNDDDSDRFVAFTEDDIRLYLHDIGQQDPRRGILHFAIEKKDGGAYIGYCMLAELEPWHKRCKVGVTIGERSEWGKGYAHEALVPVFDYALGVLGFNRIIAEIYCTNARSRKLFEGLGFVHEGTLRQSVWKRGEPLDDCLYALLREDWAHGE